MTATFLKKGEKSSSNENPDSFRINFDNSFRRWFGRNLGVWRSRRQYFFEEEEVLNVEMILKIEKYLEKKPGELRYRLTWNTENEYDFFQKKPHYLKEGSMEISIIGHKIERNKAYLENKPSTSNIRQIDEHELIFESKYDDWYILEHTRLIDSDRYRSRVIYSWNKDNLKIVENHHEIRIKEALDLIQDS